MSCGLRLGGSIQLSAFRYQQSTIYENSPLVSELVRHASFRSRFNVAVVGLWRRNQYRLTNLAYVPLRKGERVLVQGETEAIEQLEKFADFSNVEILTPEKLEEQYHADERMFVVRLPKDSELAGTSVSKSRLADVFDFRVTGVFREGSLKVMPHGDEDLLGGDLLPHALDPQAPGGDLDMGNSGTAMRLFAGLLSAKAFDTVLTGDESLSARPMERVAAPLRAMGAAEVGFLVPNRFEYGYGLTPEIVELALQRQPDLIITVDNGISSLDGVREAKGFGIDVLVTDHHLPAEELPGADVIVNPNLPGSRFTSRNLAGVGVAFYVMAALGRRLEQDGLAGASKIAARYLDLVALGTVADVVPLDHNNRILVQQGLNRIRAGQTVAGIAALLTQAGRVVPRTVSTDLGFVVGPRINAAGRLGQAQLGVELLTISAGERAQQLAAYIDQLNATRDSLQRSVYLAANKQVKSEFNSEEDPALVVAGVGWHQGVIGVVAGRLADKYAKPVIVISLTSSS